MEKKYIFNPSGQYSGQIMFKNSVPTLQETVFATRIISLQLIILILHLHRALNKVTQSANQHMRTFIFYLLKFI